MANPQDDIGLNAELNGEFYFNERTGRTHVRLPAGGAGGGVTSYADQPVSEERYVEFLKSRADAKMAESEALRAEGERLAKHHEKARSELEKRQKAERNAADEQEREADSESFDDEQGRNPITSETYGRPPINPPGLDGEPQRHNPGDMRPEVDHQPASSPVKENETA